MAQDAFCRKHAGKPAHRQPHDRAPAAVYSFVRRTDFNVQDKIEKLLAGEAVPCRLAGELSYDALQASEESFWTLLFMTGYLTKAGPRQMEKCGISPDKVRGGTAVLAIPNKEVAKLFASAVSSGVKTR